MTGDTSAPAPKRDSKRARYAAANKSGHAQERHASPLPNLGEVNRRDRNMADTGPRSAVVRLSFQNATLRRLQQAIGSVRRRKRLRDPVRNGYPRPP